MISFEKMIRGKSIQLMLLVGHWNCLSAHKGAEAGVYRGNNRPLSNE